MNIYDGRGRHRRPKRRFTRALATVLLIGLLAGAPAAAIAPPVDRPAAYTVRER